MGKRELLIIAGFAAAGLVIWRLTAPPPAPDPGFSLDNLNEIWGERNRPAGRVSVTTNDTVALSPEIEEIRLADLQAVDVRGESRPDLAWSLVAEATGPDEATARAAASAATLRHDDLGQVVSIGVQAPDDTVRTSRLSLVVPSESRIRLESTREALVEGLDHVRLENLAGDATLRRIAGTVEGSQRNGSLTVEGAGEVSLTLAGTTATLRDVAGPLVVNARNGSTTIERPGQVTAVETTGQRLTISDAASPIRGIARGGAVVIERPGDVVDFDVRGADLTVTLSSAVPVMLFGRDAALRITLPPEVDVQLDIVAEGGTIDASAIGLTPEIGRDEQTLAAGQSGPRIVVRTQGATVVIDGGK